MQIGNVIGREQCPVAVFEYPLHEQIGHPVCRIHVVSSATVITGVLSQLQELLDVEVPCFKVGTDSAFTLAALVDCHGRIVDDFQEWHHALALAVGAFNVRT